MLKQLGLELLTFQSTLPAWGATRHRIVAIVFLVISIHAPRMGSDILCFRVIAPMNISIHAPRMGSDSKNMRFLLCFCNFH